MAKQKTIDPIVELRGLVDEIAHAEALQPDELFMLWFIRSPDATAVIMGSKWDDRAAIPLGTETENKECITPTPSSSIVLAWSLMALPITFLCCSK